MTYGELLEDFGKRMGNGMTLVGAAFDAEMRNLSDRQIEVAFHRG